MKTNFALAPAKITDPCLANDPIRQVYQRYKVSFCICSSILDYCSIHPLFILKENKKFVKVNVNSEPVQYLLIAEG